MICTILGQIMMLNKIINTFKKSKKKKQKEKNIITKAIIDFIKYNRKEIK